MVLNIRFSKNNTLRRLMDANSSETSKPFTVKKVQAKFSPKAPVTPPVGKTKQAPKQVSPPPKAQKPVVAAKVQDSLTSVKSKVLVRKPKLQAPAPEKKVQNSPTVAKLEANKTPNQGVQTTGKPKFVPQLQKKAQQNVREKEKKQDPSNSPSSGSSSAASFNRPSPVPTEPLTPLSSKSPSPPLAESKESNTPPGSYRPKPITTPTINSSSAPLPMPPFKILSHLPGGMLAKTVIARQLSITARRLTTKSPFYWRGYNNKATPRRSFVGPLPKEGSFVDDDTGRLVCLKVYNKRASDDAVKGAVARELEAFRRMAQSTHIGALFVCELQGVIEDASHIFVGMQLMQYDLLEALNRREFDRNEHGKRWIAQVAAGISALHYSGIIHRDIKPENILIDWRGNAIVADLGSTHLAKASKWVGGCVEGCKFSDFPVSKADPHGAPRKRCANSPCAPGHTHLDACTIELAGTWPYSAPEVTFMAQKIEGRKPYGAAVDWWGLGCVAFELLIDDGQPLFNSLEALQEFYEWEDGAFTNPHWTPYFHDSPITAAGKDLLGGLLRSHPDQRYTFKDLRDHPFFWNDDGGSEFDNMHEKGMHTWVLRYLHWAD